MIRLAEVLSALSLTTDLGAGMPFEKGLRTCVVASAFAVALRLSLEERRAVFHAALLRSIGCTAHAPENAAMFGDDLSFERAFKELDPADTPTFDAHFGEWDPPRQQELLARVYAETPTTGVYAVRSGCEVSAALGTRLGIGTRAIDALRDVYERWDGRGLPDGRSRDEVDPVSKIVHVAEQAVLGHYAGGMECARTTVARRSGGHLDPELCGDFLRSCDAVMGSLEVPDMLEAVVAVEPPPGLVAESDDLDRLCLAFAIFTDLKGVHLIGHSPHVADLAAGAMRVLGADASAVAEMRATGLLHDIGRTAVSSEIWQRPGPLGHADRERVRLHTYWTERILMRCPAFAPMARPAAAHHERLNGSGYHRAANASAVAAVIEAAGLPRPRPAWPCGLTEREVEVLRLCARGMSNREIAESLVVSARTVQHHLASIYDKTGRRTRAGAAVFAVEHGLSARS